MTHLHKLRTLSIPKWVSSIFFKTPFPPNGSLMHIAKNPRFLRTIMTVETEDCDALGEISVDNGRKSRQLSRLRNKALAQAQPALLEYLHSTRGLQYREAEYISNNSPDFLRNLIEKVDQKGRSIAQFLRYHPIDEFEPFFESMGLKSHEYGPLLPRGLTFLTDDALLLENYQVLCNYGIARNRIGKIYKEAREVFGYNYGVLSSKLRAYEELGLDQNFVGKVVVCIPHLLLGDVNMNFVKVMKIWKNSGFEDSWIEEHLAGNLCNWGRLVALINLFIETGYSENQLHGLISQHPGILTDGSGERTLSLVGFLFKFGSPMNQITSMFLQFPQMQIGKFTSNLRQCFLSLNEIEMETHEIGKLVRGHPILLGSCTLKKMNSLLALLNVGKKRLCQIILDNPQEMKKWVMGSKVVALPNSGENVRSRMLKIKFLIDLGFKENSKEMEKALNTFHGKGTELRERFDAIVNAGIDREVVFKMMCRAPQILNLNKDVIEMKIDFLLNDLGYPISYLVAFPSFLNHTEQRVRSRLAMYDWLRDQKLVGPMLALSTIVACSEKIFVASYVNRHSRGPEVWEEVKRRFSPE